jgi:catechol 2,3-dioxygenase-like lactoylglutathione lyase family enzyme
MEAQMIDHMGFRVRDLATARRFYDACLVPLGLQAVDNTEESFLIGRSREEPLPFIWVGTAEPSWWSTHSTSTGPIHLAFKATTRSAVDAFHGAALAAGGTDNGKPGPRGPAAMKYYAAFVLDPDGNNIEAGVRE